MQTRTIYSSKFEANVPLRVDEIRIVWKDDPDADLSFLEQDYADCKPKEAAKYKEQDKNRLADYGKTWYMLGCRAVAEVSYPIGQGNRRLETLSSSGLWGIESDCGDDAKDVEQDQLEDLKEHLKQFGISWPEGIDKTSN